MPDQQTNQHQAKAGRLSQKLAILGVDEALAPTTNTEAVAAGFKGDKGGMAYGGWGRSWPTSQGGWAGPSRTKNLCTFTLCTFTQVNRAPNGVKQPFWR